MVYEIHNSTSALERVTTFVLENEHLLPDPLSLHVDIRSYCQKLLERGRVFVDEENEMIQGVCMGYINDTTTFISHLQVLLIMTSAQHKGAGRQLVGHFIEESKKAGMRETLLTCDLDNKRALAFYRRFGFIFSETPHPNPEKTFMTYPL